MGTSSPDMDDLPSSLASRRERSFFWTKALLAAFLVLFFAKAAFDRYSFLIDPQVRTCIPGARVLFLDRLDRDVRRGRIIAFVSDEQQPKFRKGSLIGKVVVGLPGDRVTVDAETTRVNGRVVGYGLALAGFAGLEIADLTRALIVPPHAVWVMGETVDSYDSRYWGPLPLSQLVGRAQVVL